MLSEARSLPCFQLVFDVATFESSIGSVKLDLEYSKYSRSSLTEPIDDSKVATSKTSWKHGRLRFGEDPRGDTAPRSVRSVQHPHGFWITKSFIGLMWIFFGDLIGFDWGEREFFEISPLLASDLGLDEAILVYRND
uniref:Uncharacterized protein n=1 Tax=Ananas comosus var. bracteatus TaxID=296719 RepID=A0A6V7PA83_ANACO|nr:unnamed protein product [Ananas comosus var. bracteatus]